MERMLREKIVERRLWHSLRDYGIASTDIRAMIYRSMDYNPDWSTIEHLENILEQHEQQVSAIRNAYYRHYS
jgi:hypothetical protein